jgi:hypothetical protein
MLAVAIMQMTPTTSCSQRVLFELAGVRFDIDDVAVLIFHSLLDDSYPGFFDRQQWPDKPAHCLAH